MFVTVARRLRLRFAAVALCLAALPLYAAEEAVSRLKGRPIFLPGRLVDRVDDQFIRLKEQSEAAGDGRFTAVLHRWMDYACDAIDVVLTRLTGRP